MHVKHATPLGRETLADAARDAALRGGADALVLTGTATGAPPRAEELAAVRARCEDVPLFVGSGLDEHNARALLARADGAIVGTALKHDGRVEAPVDAARVARLRACFDADPRRQRASPAAASSASPPP